MYGWDKVRSRKYASDLTFDGGLESVEYTWFTNDRAMVVLTQIPFTSGKRMVRFSEILFYAPVHQLDIPPRSPQLVVLAHDSSMCSCCMEAICSCPHALNVSQSTGKTCTVTRSVHHEGEGKPFTQTEQIVETWEHRARVLYHGSKRGLLTLVYRGDAQGTFPQITVRQEYTSLCENQDAVACRIQSHLTKLLSRFPQLQPINQSTTTALKLPVLPEILERRQDDCLILSSKRPAGMSGGPEDGGQGSFCGPEKAGKDCDCSAEKMQDPSLALILNSRRDQIIANMITEMRTPLVEPIVDPLTTSPHPRTEALIQPLFTISRDNGISQEERTTLDDAITPLGTQSSESTHCGTSAALPSPLLPSRLPQAEPSQKRPRPDPLLKAEGFSFSADRGWSCGPDDRANGIQLPTWNMPNLPERPLSGLGRALGITRSPSPPAFVSSRQKTPSPSALPPAQRVPATRRSRMGEVDFHGVFDSGTRVTSDVDAVAKLEANLNSVAQLPSRRLNSKGKQATKREASEMGKSRQLTGAAIASTPENAGGNGSRCEICGFSFAKRSNKVRHIHTVHNRVKRFKCDLCGTKFGLKADLGRHRFRMHESRAFRCSNCGKSFAEESQLEHHVRVTHEEASRPWDCEVCRMQFGRKSSLTRHEQTVHQQTRFVCRICKKTYSQKFDAVRHERRVHGLTDKGVGAGVKQIIGGGP